MARGGKRVARSATSTPPDTTPEGLAEPSPEPTGDAPEADESTPAAAPVDAAPPPPGPRYVALTTILFPGRTYLPGDALPPEATTWGMVAGEAYRLE